MTIELMQRDFIKYNILSFLLVSELMRSCEALFRHPVGSNMYIQKVYVISIMIKRFASSTPCLVPIQIYDAESIHRCGPL